MRKDEKEVRCGKKDLSHKSNPVSRVLNLNRKGSSVAADMLVNIVCLTCIVLFMVWYWILSTPTVIQNASFSGDVIDMSAEQFVATMYKTPTDDGTVLDSIKKYLDDEELRGEEYAKKVFLKKFLSGNPLRYHQADWIITITEGDLLQGSIQSKDATAPKSFMIDNPFYEAYSAVEVDQASHTLQSKESFRTKTVKVNDIRTTYQRYKTQYQQSTPIVIQNGDKEYTVQTFYITGSVLNKIIPVAEGRDRNGEREFLDYFNTKDTRDVSGERIRTMLLYKQSISTGTIDCTKITSCDDYQKDENSCNTDPCYISKTYCGFKSDEARCVEG